MKDKWVWRAAAVLVGGLISVYSSQEVRIWVLAFFLLLFVRLWFWKPSDFFGRWYRPEVILLAAGVLTGYIYGMTAEKELPRPLVVDRLTLTGRLADWVVTDSGARGIVELEKVYYFESSSPEQLEELREKLGRKYLVRVYSDRTGGVKEGWSRVRPGNRIRFEARLEHPRAPSIEGGFDPSLYYAVRGITGTLTARGDADFLEEGRPPLTWLIRERIRTVLLPYWPEETGILEGILFGDSSRIPPDIIDIYKTTGVMHVFAASGANAAFVTALAWLLFFFLPKRMRILASIGFIVLYAALCSGNPPILRATIMGSAVLLGMFGRGKVSSLRWLLYSGVILFVWNPLYVRDISFQLSFAAAWGIIVLSPRINKMSWLEKFPPVLRFAVSAAFGAQIASLPLLISVFHRVSLIGFAVNVLVLFVLGAVLQLGLIGTILAFAKPLALVFFQVSFWLLEFTNAVLGYLAGFPLADFWVLEPGILFWVFWYIVIAVILIGREKLWFVFMVQVRKIKRLLSWFGQNEGQFSQEVSAGFKDSGSFFGLKAVLFSYKDCLLRFLFIFLFVIFLWSPWIPGEKLEITFLDVGQGDCILIQTPGENFLVDAGPKLDNFDAGEKIIVPYLLEEKVGRLDVVFITHEDGDHIGGAGYLLNNIPTDLVAVPELGERLASREWQNGIPAVIWSSPEKLVRLKAGDSLNFESGLTVEVLAPTGVLTGTGADANNNSLVLLLHYLDRKILLAGDMEGEEIRTIVERGGKWDADFIKIPHHGARSSFDESWFDQTYPRAVFISVGKNRFGHPSPEVLAYWRQRGIPVYRTDIHGTIRLTIDKKGSSLNYALKNAALWYN